MIAKGVIRQDDTLLQMDISFDRTRVTLTDLSFGTIGNGEFVVRGTISFKKKTHGQTSYLHIVHYKRAQ